MSNNNKGIDFIEQGGMIILPSQRLQSNLFPMKNQASFNDHGNFMIQPKKQIKKRPLKKLIAAAT